MDTRFIYGEVSLSKLIWTGYVNFIISGLVLETSLIYPSYSDPYFYYYDGISSLDN